MTIKFKLTKMLSRRLGKETLQIEAPDLSAALEKFKKESQLEKMNCIFSLNGEKINLENVSGIKLSDNNTVDVFLPMGGG